MHRAETRGQTDEDGARKRSGKRDARAKESARDAPGNGREGEGTSGGACAGVGIDEGALSEIVSSRALEGGGGVSTISGSKKLEANERHCRFGPLSILTVIAGGCNKNCCGIARFDDKAMVYLENESFDRIVSKIYEFYGL